MHKVAIIGTGVSGLAAALEIEKRAPKSSVEITLFESRHIPGGRTRSFLDTETGDTLDNGQHLLMGCYHSTIKYLQEIGTEHLLGRPKRLRIPFAIFNEFAGRSRIATLRTAFLPAPFHTLYGVLRTDLLTAEEKVGAVRLGLRTASLHRDPRTLRWTCNELFQHLHQPVGLIHKLWEPLCLATINASTKEASARVFLNVLRIALLTNRTNSALLFPTVGLSELLIDPAVNLLKTRGIGFRFRSQVNSILTQEGAYELRVGTSQDSELFDMVILTTPNVGISLPERIILPQVKMSPIVNAYFWVDHPIINSPIHGFLNTTLQWAFAKPSQFSGQRIALTISAAHELVERPNEEIISILWRDLKNSLPEASNAHLLHAQIIKEKRATPHFTPETFLARPETTTTLSGFYLAGDLVQNHLPATIEGAILNGIAAAKQVIQHITNK